MKLNFIFIFRAETIAGRTAVSSENEIHFHFHINCTLLGQCVSVFRISLRDKEIREHTHMLRGPARLPFARMTRHGLIFAGCVALWLLSVGAGAKVAWDYQTTAGAPGEPPGRWPAASAIAAPSNGATLLLIAHPHCPCTKASVGELARVMARLPGRVSAHVLVYRPSEFAAGWERTEVWSAAERIPGVAVRVDVDGAEAALFGAATSGQVLLYDAGGRLRFNGGITSARGHLGESPGHQRIAAVVEGRETEEATSRVFGCALAGPPQGD
jgi:hypothetical protein